MKDKKTDDKPDGAHHADEDDKYDEEHFDEDEPQYDDDYGKGKDKCRRIGYGKGKIIKEKASQLLYYFSIDTLLIIG